jgi:hypothetical protein
LLSPLDLEEARGVEARGHTINHEYCCMEIFMLLHESIRIRSQQPTIRAVLQERHTTDSRQTDSTSDSTLDSTSGKGSEQGEGTRDSTLVKVKQKKAQQRPRKHGEERCNIELFS